MSLWTLKNKELESPFVTVYILLDEEIYVQVITFTRQIPKIQERQWCNTDKVHKYNGISKTIFRRCPWYKTPLIR